MSQDSGLQLGAPGSRHIPTLPGSAICTLSSERTKDKRLETWLGGLWPACPGHSTCHISVLPPSGVGPEASAIALAWLAFLMFAVPASLVGQLGRNLGRDRRIHLVSFYLKSGDKAAISSLTCQGCP